MINHSLQSTVLLSLSQRKQITRAIETEEENPGKRMPLTGGRVERNSFSEPPDHQSSKKPFCLIFSAATPRLTLQHTRHRLPLAQNPTAACPLDIPYLLRGQGTTLLLVVPTTPCHTLTGLPPRKGRCWHSEPPGSYRCTVKHITCFFDPTHTSS